MMTGHLSDHGLVRTGGRTGKEEEVEAERMKIPEDTWNLVKAATDYFLIRNSSL